MTNTNGTHAADVAAEPDDEPALTSYSLDYWREMTERQVERLRARIRELEDEAAPLRMQISALTLALRSTGTHEAPRPGGLFAQPGPSAAAKHAYNHRGEDITAAQEALLADMLRQGKTVSEVRAVIPGVKPGQVYARAQKVRKQMAQEILEREAFR